MELYIIALICIFTILNNSLCVDARYCKYEFAGQIKYYACPRNEYCCNLGCCISPTFPFYQLWYYWLMVIFMFVVCSGGQWWYRYWVNNNGYLTDLGSAMPGRSTTLSAMARDNAANRNRGNTPLRSTRVAYHPATDAVVLHNIWKPPYSDRSNSSNINMPTRAPPSYSQATQQQQVGSSSGLTRDALIAPVAPPPPPPPPTASPKPSTPYMQLYGPPPSYESVVGLSNLADQQPQVSQPTQQIPGTHQHR
ncbi:hypothetical protein O3M35_008976 [Rhynocoris fuscipes]|uniref:Vesicular, overexpressed in cancer, prosurvival protein 1 n=1 Tax=Rhynocoris fuscipes TaxID=488301 RepID=A0AAW1D269_9HEMI